MEIKKEDLIELCKSKNSEYISHEVKEYIVEIKVIATQKIDFRTLDVMLHQLKTRQEHNGLIEVADWYNKHIKTAEMVGFFEATEEQKTDIVNLYRLAFPT